MAEPSIMLTHSTRSWVQRLHFHLVDHGGGLLSGYALSADDILRASPDVLFIDDICSFASRRLVEDLARLSVTIIGVYDPGESGAGRRRLDELGIKRQASADATVEALLALIAPSTSGPPTPPRDVYAGTRHSRRGSIVAVAAAAAGAGATEVSASLAWFGARRAPVVLADVDENTPSIAVRLGMPLYPGLSKAARAVEDQTSFDDVLHQGERRRLAVLVGSARGVDRRVRADEATSVLDRLAGSSHVVANCGATVEDDRFAGMQARSEVTRAVLAAADVVVLVAVAGPVGIVRLADWLDEGSRLVDPARLHVVMNRFPRGGFRSDEMLRELRSLIDAASVRTLPHDSRVDRAAWLGRHVSRGPFARRVRRMARELLPARFPVR